ncbi:MAG: tetratricopeptide repeat protein, partial [Candidatus Paceibacterales bacterium]
VELTKTCSDFYPENNLTYVKKDIELISQAVKIQPLYTRYWILLGNATITLANEEKNPETKTQLLNTANGYLNKALVLGPKYQEITLEQARMELVAGDYQKLQAYANTCIALNPGLGDCWWYLGLSQIYLKNPTDAQKNLQLAYNKLFNINSKENLGQLADAYYAISDWQDLVLVYQKLIAASPNVAQYHSSLAYFYKMLGQYEKARQEAMEVLRISPESKPNVDAFLKTLP